MFSMNCFLNPKTTCDETNAIISEFWLGIFEMFVSTEERRGHRISGPV